MKMIFRICSGDKKKSVIHFEPVHGQGKNVITAAMLFSHCT